MKNISNETVTSTDYTLRPMNCTVLAQDIQEVRPTTQTRDNNTNYVPRYCDHVSE